MYSAFFTLGCTTKFTDNVTGKLHILPITILPCSVVPTCFGLHSYHQGSYYHVTWRY